MKTIVIVENDFVVNRIVVDDSFTPDDTHLEDGEGIDGQLWIGYQRREGKWGNPETQDFIDHEWRGREPEETVEYHPASPGESPDPRPPVAE